MILFSTRNSRHLAEKISAHHGACTIKQFSDGELFVQIDEDVRGKHVFVLASTQPPADNALELFLLLDALNYAGARITLFISYFGYARQVIAATGQARSAQVMSSFLKHFALHKIIILHAHSTLLHDFLSYTNVIDLSFFSTLAHEYDAIVAPDKGASSWAKELSTLCNKEMIVLKKTRPDHEQVVIDAIDGNVHGKRLLIVDDIISTGRTLIQAAHALHTMGASHIAAAATHGIFSSGADVLLEQSILERIIVTNSIAQQSRGKIHVVDASAFIGKILFEHSL